MNLEGAICRLRAVEVRDVEAMYRWENDVEVWSISGTTEPFSRHTLERFVEQQQLDIYRTRQLRLVVESLDERPIGALDLFEFDPHNRRAGIGILIHDKADRGRGYAADALDALCNYARTILGLHQIWCNVGANNASSLQLFHKAGFTDIGTKRGWLWTPEGYVDEVMMQKIL